MEAHRAGPLKQSNKTHKTGQHKSKGQLRKENKGRISVKVIGKKKHTANRQERRNQLNQIRKHKREDIISKKRLKGATGCPLLTAIVPLNCNINGSAVLGELKECDETLTVKVNDLGITHICVPKYKQRLSFFVPQFGNLYDLLDITKVCDSVLFLVNSDGIDAYGEQYLTCIFAQGCPAYILGYINDKQESVKKQAQLKKAVAKSLSNRFPDEKLHNIDSEQEKMLLLRFLGEQKLRDLKMRENRPHLLAEDLSFELVESEGKLGTLKVSGYVRGQTLSVNSLVHIPGWGDFQMKQIDAPQDPYPYVDEKVKSRKNSVNAMEDVGYSEIMDIRVLEKADSSRQESLQSEVIPNPMEGEQTWPTEEELAQAEAEQKKRVKRVPKGMSEYQASWIVDEHSEEDEAEEEDSDCMEAQVIEDEDETNLSDIEDEEEYQQLEVGEDEDARYDASMNIDEDEQMLSKYKEERLHVMFPDEVDTPMESNARARFQKYRGLKSFRTSEWNPKENLPLDYARIFQFENFNRTKRKVLFELAEKQGAQVGWYVTLHIKDVPREAVESYVHGKPYVIFGLLKHEQKMSVCNYVLHCNGRNKKPVKSKELMIFHVGYRRFSATPVYSQHTNGDKHKIEKFLPNEGVVIATVYAPVMFPPASVLMFSPALNGEHELIAAGSFLSVNPDRINAKRIVLSGHPFKINRKTATVRYMFFNKEDIAWFKPVELRTKWGRRGHIKESLGTHGHMKCVFDGQLKSQDTVLMNLYKRVYPKWTYNTRLDNPICSDISHQNVFEDEEMTN